MYVCVCVCARVIERAAVQPHMQPCSTGGGGCLRCMPCGVAVQATRRANTVDHCALWTVGYDRA